jgi:hypothetical protein
MAATSFASALETAVEKILEAYDPFLTALV